MNSDEKRIADRVSAALRRCLPVTKADAQLTCETCPYQKRCDQGNYELSAVRLPTVLIEDIRRLVK